MQTQSQTIAKRKFSAPGPGGKGIVTATAKLVGYMGQAPYFSVTTGNGCEHNLILAAMPELKPLVDLHLCTEDGKPMHAAANALHWIKERKPAVLAKHLRIPMSAACELIDEYGWERDNAVALVEDYHDQIKKDFLNRYRQLPSTLAIRMSDWSESERRKKHTLRELAEQTNEASESLSAWLGLVNRKTFRGFMEDPLNGKWYTGGRATWSARLLLSKKLLEQAVRLASRESRFTMATYNRLGVFDTVQARTEETRDLWHQIYRIFTKEDELLPAIAIGAETRMQQWLSDIIESCFASCWQRQADTAREMLDGPDVEAEIEYTSDDPVIKIAGEEGVIIDSVQHYTSLPLVELGGCSYYVAIDSEEAGQEARNYWEDMATSDPAEFACMVGDETLIAWGMGRSAGPGMEKVNSLEEWLDLHLARPEEHFASYDGQEVTAQINEAAADEMGFDWEPDSEDAEGEWMSIVAYRS